MKKHITAALLPLLSSFAFAQRKELNIPGNTGASIMMADGLRAWLAVLTVEETACGELAITSYTGHPFSVYADLALDEKKVLAKHVLVAERNKKPDRQFLRLAFNVPPVAPDTNMMKHLDPVFSTVEIAYRDLIAKDDEPMPYAILDDRDREEMDTPMAYPLAIIDEETNRTWRLLVKACRCARTTE